MSVNKVILVGNVGKQPVIKQLDSGKKVANFSLATSVKNKDGNTATEWHNIVAWERIAELIEKYVNVGQQLYVEGKLQTRTWDDKDGNKRYSTEVVAWTLDFIGSKKDAAVETKTEALDEIPF